MKSPKTNFRRMVSFAFVLFVLAIAPRELLATPPQASVSASPSALAFGIPTGTSPAVSASQNVTVNITGSATATFGSPALSPSSPFQIVNNGCLNSSTTPPNTFTAPTVCVISIALGTTLTTLQTDTLTIPYTTSAGSGSSTVALSGAYGAIQLAYATTISLSQSGASFTNPTTLVSAPLNLSCPAGAPITATLSNTPDGSGYVLVDNYLVMDVSGSPVPVPGGASPTGNVCTGGQHDSFSDPNNPGINQQDCFSAAYQSAAESGGITGDNTDSLTNPGNSILADGAAGGVPPINVASYLSASNSLPVSFTLLDSGGYASSSSLFLVSSCGVLGITPGGTVQGNPTSTNTLNFDTIPNQPISITDNNAQDPPPAGTSPIGTDIAIPQQLFDQLVIGTSAAPDVCFRIQGEFDYSVNPPAPMCKGFLLQCQYTNPTTGITTTSGENCDPVTPNTMRDLYDSVQFLSPDAPETGYNYLTSATTPNACSNVVSGGSCAPKTGAALLLGSDNWTQLCSSCSAPITTTPSSPATYSVSNCVLSGGLTGDLCPLDTLTQFLGAADNTAGGSSTTHNSVFIPVANHPLPSTQTTITNENANGWVNSSTALVNFTSSPATYSGGASNPPVNGFSAASAYSVTYGITPASQQLPDTTIAVPTDTTVWNTTSSPFFVSPFCTSGVTTPSFTTTGNAVTPPADGIYNLHFFTTDCALTEELVFNPQGTQLTPGSNANWASFRYVTFGVDTLAPTFSCLNPPLADAYGWYNTNVTVSCTATDQDWYAGISGSGFGPPINGIQGSQTEPVNVSTSVPTGVNPLAATVPQMACDLAGNCVSVTAPGTFRIDRQAPVITQLILGGSTPYYVNGPAIPVMFSCSDGTGGSGIAICNGSGPGASNPSCNGATPVDSCTTTISTASALTNATFTVTATDKAGNSATPSSVNYTISKAPSADLWAFALPFVLPVPDFIPQNSTGQWAAAVVDLSANPGNNVVITSKFTVPNGILSGGGITGFINEESCSLKTSPPCMNVPGSGEACSVTVAPGAPGTTVTTLTCNVGVLPSASMGKGEVLMVKIPVASTAPVNSKFTSVTTVSSDDDPNPSNNTVSETYYVIK